jgi:hypothetical protein
LTFDVAARSALFRPIALVIGLSAPLLASPQTPAQDLPVSLDRIREALAKPDAPRLRVDIPVEVPVATFKTRVEQRVYVPSLEESLAKEFNLTDLQRQSAAWAAKCCGMDLGLLIKPIDRALDRRKERKIREQIARELAELDAARRKADPRVW